ncbi:MAG: thioredoxin domain-containing protein [Gemmatimonadales bacterium]|nr:thioredoxin domain-containing protein [Gemmatimonadales bacterium]
MRALAPLVAAALAAAPLAAQAAPGTIAQRTKGSATAPVTVYEMSDFQCPYCRRFALETFPALESEYVRAGKVRWVFVNLPLTQIHPNAAPAAILAVCAAQQRRFWPVHDVLFRTQATWAPLKDPAAFFRSLADSAQLDRSALDACMTKGEAEAEVRADAEGAARAGARGTPSFYIEGLFAPGAVPLEAFRQVLDSIGAAKAAARK